MEVRVKTNLIFLCSCGLELEFLRQRIEGVLTFKPCSACMLDHFNDGYDQRVKEEETKS